MVQSNVVINRFTSLLKRTRKDLSLTQREISDLLGIKQAQYSGYELGKNLPRIDSLFVYLNILEINSIEFFKLLCSEESLDKISKDQLLSRLKASM